MSWKVKITTEKGSLILPTYRTKREAEEAAEIARGFPGTVKAEVFNTREEGRK